jgi:hypothetical protein
MADDVFLCFNCGKRNRVYATGNRSIANCGSCGKPLFPVDSVQPAINSSELRRAPEYATPTSTPKQSMWTARKVVTLTVVALLLWGAFFDAGKPARKLPPIYSGQNNTATSPVSQALTQVASAPLPPAVEQNTGLVWNRTGRRAEAPLTIVTSSGSDYYVKLIDAYTGADAIAIFVKGGQRIDVEVPIGSYKFRYATGVTWRGEQALFGPEGLTSYNEAGDRFDFLDQGESVSGYTVELISQENGNLSTHKIDMSQF